MAFMAPALALQPGRNEIDLFGDGSFQNLISFGSWTFYAPGFGLENSGRSKGKEWYVR